MSEKKESARRASETATRRRKSLAGDAGGRQVSRPLLIAVLVIVVGGGYLFWPRGGDVPTGIGEQYSVVTADTTAHEGAPRSGSVDIDDEQTALTPEAPVARAAAGTDAPRRPIVVDDPEAEDSADPSQPPAADRIAEPREAPAEHPPAQPQPRIEPAPSGPWAVQLGAYQTRANADKVVADLAVKGIDAHVRAANTSSGEMIHRVWIGWFTTRNDAQGFARQEKDRIGDAYPVHR